MDKVERKHPNAKCEECPLREVGKFVPSILPDRAELAFVGEAPGFQETVYKEPFVGPSGKLLDIVLAHHGIDREGVVLTNACLCRPPGNDTPPKSAINACRPRLLLELERAGVGTAVALGNSAAEALTGQSGVTKLRVGPGQRSPYNSDIRVLSTFHPAACLRQGDFFPYLVTDIGKVNYDPPVWIEPTILIADTVDLALTLMDEVDRRLTEGLVVENPERVLVVDIEVDIEKDTGFGHPNQYGMLCVGIGFDRHSVLVLSEGVMGEEAVLVRLGQLLRRWKLVAQNGKFDLSGLYPHLGGLELYFDTMLASYVFDERPGIHGLKFQAVELLGAPQYDNEVKKYVGPSDGYGVIPRDILYRYNAYDVACTYSLYLMRLALFNDGNQELRRVHDFLVAASNELMYIELNGIQVDKEYLKELDAEYRKSLHEIEDKIDNVIEPFRIVYDKKFGGINPRSPMQVKKFLADHHVNVDSTNEETMIFLLDRLERFDDDDPEIKGVKEFVQLLLAHRKEAKLHGTYVKGISKRLYRGRVYSSYLLHGTTTGRLASRNPNMQNIPRGPKIRNLFVTAKPENVFLHTDYAQAELRVLCFLSRDAYLRTVFNDPTRDLFDELTPVLYPELPPKELVPKEEWKEIRIRVKAYVYGLGYGREAFSIAKEFGITTSEAEDGMRRFFEVIPDVVRFREEVKEKVLDGQDLVTPWGRHRRYSLITKENKSSTLKEALAFLPQSTASDMCLQALIWTRQETKGFAWIRNTMHDALLIETHPDDVEEVKEITERNMLKAAQSIVGDYVRFGTDTTIGKRWGEV